MPKVGVEPESDWNQITCAGNSFRCQRLHTFYSVFFSFRGGESMNESERRSSAGLNTHMSGNWKAKTICSNLLIQINDRRTGFPSSLFTPSHTRTHTHPGTPNTTINYTRIEFEKLQTTFSRPAESISYQTNHKKAPFKRKNPLAKRRETGEHKRWW